MAKLEQAENAGAEGAFCEAIHLDPDAWALAYSPP